MRIVRELERWRPISETDFKPLSQNGLRVSTATCTKIYVAEVIIIIIIINISIITNDRIRVMIYITRSLQENFTKSNNDALQWQRWLNVVQLFIMSIDGISDDSVIRRWKERRCEFPVKNLQGLDVTQWGGQTVPGLWRNYRNCPITEGWKPCGWDGQR